MLEFVEGDLFDSGANVLVNTVNCVGVMGKGVALAFKNRYPTMFREYKAACDTGKVQPGRLHIWTDQNGVTVVNFPTKRHWKQPSRYEDIEAGLIAFRKYILDRGPVRVALPALGCGHGGLDWGRVSKMIREHLAGLDADIMVYGPSFSQSINGKAHKPTKPDLFGSAAMSQNQAPQVNHDAGFAGVTTPAEAQEAQVLATTRPQQAEAPSSIKRLIEVDLPIARISAHARREKSIRHGHISTLHIWWARRPLAACRAVICAALWPDPADPNCPQTFRDAAAKCLVAFAKRVNPVGINDEKRHLQEHASPESLARWETFADPKTKLDPTDADHQNILRFALLDFIADFANWDNSTVPAYLETSRALTQAAHEALGGELGTRPLVVDPFAGGGSIPLETLRVGADAFASDLNPVAVLLNKVVLEYIPKYGQKLADEVRKWGAWIKEQAEKELAKFYPKDPDGATPIAYLWARVVISDAPGQEELPVEIPLIRSMWLCKKPNRKIALKWVRNGRGEVITETVTNSYLNGEVRTVRRPILDIAASTNDLQVDIRTSKGGSATCPVTGHTVTVQGVRDQLSKRAGGAGDARLLAVVVSTKTGRVYRLPNASDVQHSLLCGGKSGEMDRSETLFGKLNHLRGFFNVVLYGIVSWNEMFSPRQLKTLLILSDLIRASKLSDLKNADALVDDMHAAIATCLAVSLDRLADYSSSSCAWASNGEYFGHTFGRQALPMIWDFAELSPFADSGWSGAVEWVAKVIESVGSAGLQPGSVMQGSATKPLLPDGSVDAVVSDPPYYAAIPYADCSDFFFGWLKRTVGHIHADLFANDLSPKKEECVQLSHRGAMYREKDAAWFEAQMSLACAQARREVRQNGIGVFVFANKETAGWEAMLAALIGAGWTITASWPVDTEMGERFRARNSAALASSVHLVCRPRMGDEVGDWRDILAELPVRMHDWMPRLANEGVVGADAIFACLGPGLEIFSRYSRVEKASGDVVPLKEYLEHVWAAVSKEALSTIFRDADASGLEPDARLTAMWLWTVGGGKAVAASKNGDSADEEPDDAEDEEEKPAGKAAATGFGLEFDAARKIAQGLGIDLEKSESIVEVKGDKARLLAVAERTKHLFGKDTAETGVATKKTKKPRQGSLFEELDQAEEAGGGWKELKGPPPGTTVLDRLHQAMILFGAQRGELLKRFLVEDGVGKDARFWKLAQSLAALYPIGTDERRWVEGVLARKKGLGL